MCEKIQSGQRSPGQWSSERAWEWYNAQPWIRGFAGYPSNCVNRIALWQAYGHKEVMEQLDYELGLAADIGYNAVRAVIQFECWYYEHDAFMQNLEDYLTVADRHGIKVMLCLGNDCCVPKTFWKAPVFGEQPVDWGYHSGIKKGPHAGGYTEPGYQLLDDPEIGPSYFTMVDEIAGKYAKDERIQIWDVWNEIGNSRRGVMSVPAMERFFEIIRSHDPIQPLTADIWRMTTDWSKVTPEELRAVELSDVITFHYYGPYPDMVQIIEVLREHCDRPLINNEWLNRLGGNYIDEIFPLFYLEKIGSYNWGLMQGYSQTFEPWGGMFDEAFLQGKRDLTKWQHDLFRFNGYPYDPNETKLIKRFCDLADKRWEREMGK